MLYKGTSIRFVKKDIFGRNIYEKRKKGKITRFKL